MALLNSLGALYRHMAGQVTDLEARFIIKKRVNLDWASIIAHPDKIITADELEIIQKDMDRRLAGEPLSRIYGEREFWGLNFKIAPDTLDPRPDTETLVRLALQTFHVKQPVEILDLGTGSGCILIALLSELRESSGIGVDLSPKAIQIAHENAKTNDVDARIQWICGSWADAIDGQVDLIVSNPPYIASSVIPNLDPEVRNHDPILALDGGMDGLQAYKIIFSQLPRLLKKGGRAFLEIGFDQERSIARLSEDSRIRIERIHPDLAGLPRVVEITRGDK